jgi:hypothetical protein
VKEDAYNQAWKKIFDELSVREKILSSGLVHLTAKQIKTIGHQEPRNMAKWDSRGARPKIMQELGITILPTSRSGYVLIKGDGYKEIPPAEAPSHHPPSKLEPFTTLSWREELTKESVAIDVTAISSMLKKFTGETDLALTIRGRSGTSKFGFDFQGAVKIHRIAVDRAQIEVDAGFEGDSVWLIEAKIGEPEDFLVRQLYYPWREWSTLTRKPVVPLFLNYSNKTFGLFRYGFASAENYHSITLLEKRWFTLDTPEGVDSLENLFDSSKPVMPPKPFSQADTLGTVIAAVELFAGEITTAAGLAERLGFDERQGQYYTTASLWLGLIERAGGKINLSARGNEFVHASRWARFKILFKSVAATPVFRECIRRNLEQKPMPDREIAELILAKGYATKSTAHRRAQTVIAWLDWLRREYANLQA